MSEAEDIQRRVEIDRLLSAANAYRVKGDLLGAENACRSALRMDSENDTARELLGDVLRSIGKLDDAQEQYRTLLQRAKPPSSAETKYARVALEIAERERERHEVEEAFAHPESKEEAGRSAGIALGLSLIAPGFGQIYLGEMLKGCIVAGAFLLSLIAVAVSSETSSFILQTFRVITSGRANPDGSTLALQWPSAWLLLFFGIGLFSYVYSVIDVPVTIAKRERRKQKRADRGSDSQ